MNDPFTPAQNTIIERVIAEEETKRRHLVIAVSGAHAYGFPSPDSDIDLKAIHIDPIERVIGLKPSTGAFDRMEVIEGVEIDYTSNELKPVLVGILQGNGNYIERVLGTLQPFASPALEALAPLVKGALSRRIFRHYLGFATSQLKAYQSERPASAKKLLYVLRTSLTGAHALRTGEIVTDLSLLIDDYGFSDARELIAQKRAGEKAPLSEAMAARWEAEVERAFAALDEAHKASILPPEPTGEAALEDWLLALRKKQISAA